MSGRSSTTSHRIAARPSVSAACRERTRKALLRAPGGFGRTAWERSWSRSVKTAPWPAHPRVCRPCRASPWPRWIPRRPVTPSTVLSQWHWPRAGRWRMPCASPTRRAHSRALVVAPRRLCPLERTSSGCSETVPRRQEGRALGPSTVVITPPQAGRLLEATLVALRAELSALPEDVLTFHPAPGEWCAGEALGHLIEAERRGFSGRIRIILEAQDPSLEAWDQVAVARERQDCRRDVALLLEEFTRTRNVGVALAARLAAADLTRGGHHPQVGYLRVGDILQEWIHHDRNHLRQIMANVQAFVWPVMGATQRFSAP